MLPKKSMIQKYPQFLEFFLYDLLPQDGSFSTRKMFWAYAIYRYKKIFALCIDEEIYLRKNIFNEAYWVHQFSYKRNGKQVFLPYFRVDENILENREKLLAYIEASLDY